MKTSGLVIAINTDENAPIMSDCDYYALEWQGKNYPKLMFFLLRNRISNGGVLKKIKRP
ncbi:MAG: hypothetical protein KAQ72_10580 [Desulfobacula sp.]|nr:hypothetical protein [Desulfobacula sp.]